MRRQSTAVAYCQDGQRQSTAKRAGFIPSPVRSRFGRDGAGKCAAKAQRRICQYAPRRADFASSVPASSAPVGRRAGRQNVRTSARPSPPFSPRRLHSLSLRRTTPPSLPLPRSSLRHQRTVHRLSALPLLALFSLRSNDARRTPTGVSQRGKAARPPTACTCLRQPVLDGQSRVPQVQVCRRHRRTQPTTCTSASGSARSSPASAAQR
jgi:hypothetical protein